MLFENLDLDEKLLRALKVEKFLEPTDIQKHAIPLILKKKDLMATAQTGSGKTAAFLLPILQMLQTPSKNDQTRGPRALVLAPTRELANQIFETAKKIGRFTSSKFGCVTGGVPYFSQERTLKGFIDLLIATPGRLMDHMEQGKVDFDRLEFLVLDEADRMLDMGFKKDIERIISEMPDERQTLLFSATLEGEIERIAQKFLKKPEQVQLAPKAKPHALIHQRIHQVDDIKHKHLLLNHVLQEPGMWQAIVFTRTKHGAERLAQDLMDAKIPCAALHGDMKQSKRTYTLQRMHKGELQVLVATDVAARGIDVKKISHVINFDMPKTAEDYVHRIGRTGRSGETGIAVSFVAQDEWRQISQIEKFTGQSLERCVIKGLEPKKVVTRPKSNGRHERSFSKPKTKQGSNKQGSNKNFKFKPKSKSNNGNSNNSHNNNKKHFKKFKPAKQFA